MFVRKVLPAVLFLLECNVESLGTFYKAFYASSIWLPCDPITQASTDWAKAGHLIQRSKACGLTRYKGSVQ